MSLELVLNITVAIVFGFTGLYVLLSNPSRKANRLFFLVTLATVGRISLRAQEIATLDLVTWRPVGSLLTSLIIGLFIHLMTDFPWASGLVPPRDTSQGLSGRFLKLERALRSKPALKLAFAYVPVLALGILVALWPREYAGLGPAMSPLNEPAVAHVRWTPGLVANTLIGVFYGLYVFLNLLSRYRLGTEAERMQASILMLGTALTGLIWPFQVFLSFPWGPASLPLIFAFAYTVGRHRLLLVPVSEESVPAKPRFDLPRSVCYLVQESKPDFCFRVFADLVTHGAQGLCLTRTMPGEIRQKHGLEKTPIVWVGEQAPSTEIRSVHDPDEIAYVIAKYLKEASDGVVVFDSLEYLIQTADFRKTLKLLYHLKEVVARNNARLLFSVNPDILQKHEMAVLEKEFKLLAEGSGRKVK